MQPEEHPDEKTCVLPFTSSGAAGPEVIAGDEIPSGAANVYYPSAYSYDLMESQARVALAAELMWSRPLQPLCREDNVSST